jgi:hypothetical protein
MNEILITILLVLLLIILVSYLLQKIYKIDDKKISFFTLSIINFIWIIIFSLIIIFFAFRNDEFWIFWKKIIITNNDKNQIVKEYKIATISWTTIKWDSFSWSLYYLNGDVKTFPNSALYNTYYNKDYITKDDMKDIYMENINKRIESFQNLISIFLTASTIFLSVLWYLWYKSINDFEEKSDKKLGDKIKEVDNIKNRLKQLENKDSIDVNENRNNPNNEIREKTAKILIEEEKGSNIKYSPQIED